VEREYSEAYGEIYRRHWWWRAREEVVVETLRRHLPKRGGAEILDIGCGDGFLFDRLAEFGRAEGVEPESAMIGDRFRGRIYPVPFDERFQPNKRYAVVLMLDVLEHLREAKAALRHATELIEPGGTLLVTVPAFPALWTAHDDLNHHVRRYTRRSFRELAQGEALRIIEERYLFQALFPVKLALRAVESLFRLAPRVPSVPPAWLNQALRGYVRAEEKIFRKIPAPFGSSLLVVMRKTA
jgi:SAM-dependent methyltransferase